MVLMSPSRDNRCRFRYTVPRLTFGRRRRTISYTSSAVGSLCVVDHAIVDKLVRVGAGARIGWQDDRSPSPQTGSYNGITVVGKNAWIPACTRIGSNCTIAADLSENVFEQDVIPSETSVGIVDQ